MSTEIKDRPRRFETAIFVPSKKSKDEDGGDEAATSAPILYTSRDQVCLNRESESSRLVLSCGGPKGSADQLPTEALEFSLQKDLEWRAERVLRLSPGPVRRQRLPRVLPPSSNQVLRRFFLRSFRGEPFRRQFWRIAIAVPRCRGNRLRRAGRGLLF